MTRWGRKKTQINKINVEKVVRTTNTNEIQRINRDYFENLCSSKLENLEDMDTFLEAYNQPKFNQEDVNHLNKSITSNEIEAVIESPYNEEPRT
jgi:hypothetical protein